jgi:hypothetical protein
VNKAFVKESEDPGDRCPVCRGFGKTVQQATLRAHIPDEARACLAETAFFCAAPTCTVAYFDQFEQFVTVERLIKPLYPKDPEAPICPCFGLRCGDIDADIDENGVTRVKAHLQQAQSDEAHCSTVTGDGRSCVPAVQKYYMQRRIAP